MSDLMVCVIAAWLECFPEKSTWCRNEQVCGGGEGAKSVNHFEQSNGLDTALYKNYLFLQCNNLSLPHNAYLIHVTSHIVMLTRSTAKKSETTVNDPIDTPPLFSQNPDEWIQIIQSESATLDTRSARVFTDRLRKTLRPKFQRSNLGPWVRVVVEP